MPKRALLIDHVTIAGSDLSALRQELAKAGIATAYGGAHSNGVTYMAVAPFADGSYLELISTIERGVRDAPLWPAQILGNGGACAWALRCEDLEAELGRLSALGITVRGPEPLDRMRPDGVLLRWRLGFLGDGPPGSQLPFLIEDVTPRELRIEPPAKDWVKSNGAELGLAAVERVVLGVAKASPLVEQLQTAYGIAPADSVLWPELEANVIAFPQAPIAVAEPAGTSGWLARRLERFGPSPCAFLFQAGDAPHDLGDGHETRRWLTPGSWTDLKIGLVDPS